MSSLAHLFDSSLPIEVKRSISKALLTLFGCVGFTAVGAWNLVTQYGAHREVWFSALGIGFFGLGGLASLVSLFDDRPRIFLDKGGVWVRGWKGCPIEWNDIGSAWKYEQRVATVFSQIKIDYVCLSIKHADNFRSKQGPIARYIAAYGRSRGMGDIYFSTKGMDADADGLVAAIQSHIGSAHLSPVGSLLPIENRNRDGGS